MWNPKVSRVWEFNSTSFIIVMEKVIKRVIESKLIYKKKKKKKKKRVSGWSGVRSFVQNPKFMREKWNFESILMKINDFNHYSTEVIEINKREKDSRWRGWTIQKIHFSTSCLPSHRKLFLTGLSVVCLSQLRCLIWEEYLRRGMVCLASWERGLSSWF